MADILGPVASVMQISEWGAKGWQTLVRKQPEYSHYWKRLEKTRCALGPLENAILPQP